MQKKPRIVQTDAENIEVTIWRGKTPICVRIHVASGYVAITSDFAQPFCSQELTILSSGESHSDLMRDVYAEIDRTWGHPNPMIAEAERQAEVNLAAVFN